MAQINFHTTPQFDDDIAIVMGVMDIPTKSKAIRLVMSYVAQTCRESLKKRAAAAQAPGPRDSSP